MKIEFDINQAIQPLVKESKKIRRGNNTIATIRNKINVLLTDLILSTEGYMCHLDEVSIEESIPILDVLKNQVIPPIIEVKAVLQSLDYYEDNNLKQKMNHYILVLEKYEFDLQMKQKTIPVSKNIPNPETKKALQDSRNGKVYKSKNKEDLMNYLNS